MYTLRAFMKTPEALDATLSRVAEMGYENVQITPPAFINSVELAKLLEKKGLCADSAMCTVYEIPNQIEQIERNTDALKTSVLRTDSISAEDRKTEAGYRSFAKHLNNCGKLLRSKGLDFMYHFHSFEFIDFGGVREVGNQAFRNCFAISRVTAPSDIHFGEGNDSVIAAMQAEENG